MAKKRTPFFLSLFFFCCAAVLIVECITAVFTEEHVRLPEFHDVYWLIDPVACAINITLLGLFVLGGVAILRRPFAAGYIVFSSYLALSSINLAKLYFHRIPLHPLDIQSLPTIVRLAPDFFGSRVIALIVVAVVAWALGLYWALRRAPLSFSWRNRLSAIAIFVVGILSVSVLVRTNRTERLLEFAGLSGDRFLPQRSSVTNGLLLQLVLDASRIAAASPPPNYSRDSVLDMARRFGVTWDASPTLSDRRPVNLIIYVMESMMDPNDFNLEYTSDPIPTIRAISATHSSGYSVSHEFGGRSANIEFEILTGMSLRLLPQETVPFHDHLKRDTPSIASLLRDRGYRTKYINAMPLWLFSAEQSALHLGFQEAKSVALCDQANVSTFAAWTRLVDRCLVDEIIAESKKSTPYFAFAFSMSAHMPYDHDEYASSKLDLTNSAHLSPEQRRHVKNYINGLHTTDRQLNRLLKHLSGIDQPTVVVAIGDHWPPGSVEWINGEKPSPMPYEHLMFRSPAVIWTNFPAKKKDFEHSTNFLAPRILAAMGLPLSGIFPLTKKVGDEYRVFSRYVAKSANGNQSQFLTEPHSPALEAYTVIQYDLLEGEQFSYRADLGPQPIARK